MTAHGRFFFDVTFTRTQIGHVGITRVVRRLLAEVAALESAGRECRPVVFHSHGFRLEPPARAAAPAVTAGGAPQPLVNLFRKITTGNLRRAVTRMLPLPVLQVCWSAFSALTFDTLSRSAASVRFREGDVVFLCDASWNYKAWKAAQAARRQGAQVVTMVHDVIPLGYPEFCAPLFTATFKTWLREMVACSDALICNSASTLHELRAYASEQGWQLPPAAHFRLGSDFAVRHSDGAIRPALRDFMAGSPNCFSAVGSIEPRKNYALLLAAFEQLWEQGGDARLVLVGRPTADCKELVAAMGAHPQHGTRFLPLFDASDAELAHVYASSRALVFPSLAEGFGLPLVEARTRGCTVIASDIPVFRELADEGVRIFEGGCVQQLRDLVEAEMRTNTAPVPIMRPFTWRDSASQFIEVNQRLLQPPAS